MNYHHAGEELEATDGASTISQSVVFKAALTYSRITSGDLSFRFQPAGFIFDSAAVDMFPEEDLKAYLLGCLNSSCMNSALTFLVPTLNAQPGDISKLPIAERYSDKGLIQGVNTCIELSKADWDSQETSWDFQRSPLL